MALPKTLTAEDLAQLLHKNPVTATADVSRAPDRLPPRLQIPGNKKPLGLEEDVVERLPDPQNGPRQCRALSGSGTCDSSAYFFASTPSSSIRSL